MFSSSGHTIDVQWPIGYCGSGTNVEESDKAGGPVNELDRICREHDLDLADTSKLTQKEADEKFITAAAKTGWLGNALGDIIYLKETAADAQPGLKAYLPGQSKSQQQQTLAPPPKKKQKTPTPKETTKP
ncbi:hypothetical protein JTE90_015891 [Oedothorax gibbosus]|uniref:Phospholipase A2-like domain-containing protein n=1 Tax=Oedothorax gibbosus TaxID=931172 RepID=A0AAV6VT75_9ARAC|nr:hypothetical protein JTE90_015891 [Oedothorax gibbosus]